MAEDNPTNDAPAADPVTDNGSSDYVPVVRKRKKHQSILRSHLSAGFAALASNKLSKSQALPNDSNPHNAVVAVNFIDPTTLNAPKTPVATGGETAARNKIAQKSAYSSSASLRDLNLYEKLNDVLERDYQNVLHSVAYTHARSGREDRIEKLFIRTSLTGSASTALATSPTNNNESASTSSANKNPNGSAAKPKLGGSRRNIMVDAAAPWGGVQPTTITDPAEWHGGPYCHVYLAACDNLDHYRIKVRPALQAFVSQMEGAAESDDGGGGGSSQYVLVYVPTIRSEESAAAAPSTSKEPSSGRKGFGRRIAAVRKNLQEGNSSNSGSAHSLLRASLGGDDDASTVASAMDGEDESHASAPPAGPIYHSSKQEKEIFKKFTADFPNGRTCILSTLLERDFVTPEASATSPLKNQEWAIFLRSLGAAVVMGFQDRIRRYHEELKKLDARRAATLLDSSGKNKFDLPHFFLVKESLAFTYEQMQMPSEALLQYEELKIFVPDASWDVDTKEETANDDNEDEDDDSEDDYDGLMYKRHISKPNPMLTPSKSQTKYLAEDAAWELAVAGDTAGFRRRIRGTRDMSSITHLLLHYLYARETQLLFKLSNPVDIITRSHAFIKALYDMRIEGILHAGLEKKKSSSKRKSSSFKPPDAQAKARMRAEAEAWALSTCWDVKSACDKYFAFRVDLETKESSTNAVSEATETKTESSGADLLVKMAMADRGDKGNADPKEEMLKEEKEASKRLSDLLEFARMRLLTLGDLELTFSNPIRAANAKQPPDTLRPWRSWEEIKSENNKGMSDISILLGERKINRLALLSESNASLGDSFLGLDSSFSDSQQDFNGSLGNLSVDMSNMSLPSRHNGKTGMATKFLSHWLRGAFASVDAFEWKYMELVRALISLLRYAARPRFADRLQVERAEMLIIRREYRLAVETLLPIIDGGDEDQWERVYYWRLFRLACCQREIGDAPLYLDTLTRCFNQRLSALAPTKTANFLQSDLESVVGESDVAPYRLNMRQCLEAELIVEPTLTGKAAHPMGYLRKKVVKHFCAVGEQANLGLVIVSHLPRPVAIDKMRLFLVTFDHFENLCRSGKNVAEADAFRILEIGKSLVVKPGKNVFPITWVPMSVGQYLLSTVEVRWKEASFFHDFVFLRKPLLGIDVLPSEPTQTIELSPLFLIPGHVQQVRLTFHAGDDIVEDGSVEFFCSEGLEVIPPGADPNDPDVKWSDTCTITFGECAPGQKLVFTTSVKSSSVQSSDHPRHSKDITEAMSSFDEEQFQTMQARVSTNFHHGLYSPVTTGDGVDAEPKSAPMKALLEAMVATLEKPALSVDSSTAFFYDKDLVMINVALHCNTPLPFYLKEWDLRLPPSLLPMDNNDLNAGLFDHPVLEGDEFFLSFMCKHVDKLPLSGEKESILQVVLKDEFGKTFDQLLSLDLESFYEQVRKQDEFSSAVTAELKCSIDEGIVGEPVHFTYHVDATTLNAAKREELASSSSSNGHSNGSTALVFIYFVSSEDSDWILGGQVQGTLQADKSGSFSVDFVGIPTRSGVLMRFPKISLKFEDSPIIVELRQPESFKSLSYTHHMALACPTSMNV
eukprot:scaffold103588_cov50-Attheya_sp.AAC.4